MKTEFKNVIEILDYFKDEETCKQMLVLQRWNGKPVCPHCQSNNVYVTNRGYKCANPECHKKFTVTVGTIFENTKIKLRYWFAAIYIATAHKKGISSHQLARDLGVTQKTAWFMLQRIREMMKEQAPQLMRNIVEVDETFIGGKRRNKHKHERARLAKNGDGYVDMQPVVGILERKGKVKLIPIPGHKVNGEILKPLVREYVSKDALLITDGFGGYKGLDKEYHHEVVNHTQDEFVRGIFHTNTLEGFWGLFKRGIFGIYHNMSSKHLHRYCNEFAYRYNTRTVKDCTRFVSSLTMVAHARLRYSDLIQA